MSVILRNVSKSFDGTPVLRSVDLTLRDGRLHGLVGANGSGKSTLVKILSGVYERDNGEINLAGEPLPKAFSPATARKLGISVIHQDTPLIQSLSVAENIAIFSDMWNRPLKRIRWKQLRNKIYDLLSNLDIVIDPTRLAESLSASQRAMVSLAMVLSHPSNHHLRLLILDEVDAAIPEDEADVFLTLARKVAVSGVPVLMVTHRLASLRKFGDDVTVLNNGSVSMTTEVSLVSDNEIISHMLTNEESPQPPDEKVSAEQWAAEVEVFLGKGDTSLRVNSDAPIMAVRHLSGRYLTDLSFDLYPGEIVGVAGLQTSGINELPEILSGISPRGSGTITIGGSVLPQNFSPRMALKKGLAVMPADRLNQGGVAMMQVDENLLLPLLSAVWRRRNLRSRLWESSRNLLDIRPPHHDTTFAKLSGRNQQKVILAKWLLTKPSVLVLNDPTNGVDPNSRVKLLNTIRGAAANGIAVLFFSTEPEQLAAYCHRVLILRRGMIATELSEKNASLSRIEITRWCYN